MFMIVSADSIRKIRSIFDEALLAVDPYKAVCRYRDMILSAYKKDKSQRIVLVSFGKAAAPMAHALAGDSGGMVSRGIIVTKYGHLGEHRFDRNIAVFEAGHPVPDENGVRAAKEVVHLLRQADENTLVVFLISGGGSALLVHPCEGISLAEKQEATNLLLAAGADIRELNTVRKHLSAIKGGRLAEIVFPGRSISLILSDVIGDPPDVIASGPTAPDASTYAEALAVIRKYGLMGKMPASVTDILAEGAAGNIPETPKKGAPVLEKAENIIIGSNAIALAAAKKAAERLGYQSIIISSVLSGEASDVAKDLAGRALEQRKTLGAGGKICLIAGGETTVTVRGKGRGGRNTEMALAFGIEIADVPGIVFLSAGTDGTDGATDAAGAIVTGDMAAQAAALGLNPRDYLARNDSYTFFKNTGGLVMTGPTGTNVMDMQLIMIEN